MNATLGFGAPRLRTGRIQQPALDRAITLRACSSRIWCSGCERRAFRVAIRTEALPGRRAAAPGG